ncbi:MAG TPA: hypothetical protein VK511_03405, partial [Gemmatimonadaceae bacterium]|nr:hypothetical protein [Gemmatimonadaceae bacterium]
SLNEVGADAGVELRDAVGYLHDANIERSIRWPQQMLATSTHDTKRSADVRARLDVLSEIPREWAKQVAKWERAHRDLKRRVDDKIAPDAHMEYVIYQTLVGMWPMRAGSGAHDAIRERVIAYAQKAAREAKGRTSWTDPNEEYERALADFIRAIFERADFLHELRAFVATIANSGSINSVARTMLQLTSPGFPDIYQGDELWNFSLVDPDNRRPVDYDVRATKLAELDDMSPTGDIKQVSAPIAFTHSDHDAIKLGVIRNVLRARAAHAPLFEHGTYIPLAAHNSLGAHIVAFARRSASSTLDDAAIVVTPRLTHALAPLAPPIGELWGDTELHLPGDFAGTRWRCAISGREFTFPAADAESGADTSNIRIPIAALLGAAPVALLLPIRDEDDSAP